jgi:tetratricopeptide (TPR) repeat protein/predicted Ser/Thr protein kinase
VSEHDDDGLFGERLEFYTFAPEQLREALPEVEIVREVGKGSMGVVYEARRDADGARVAVKILPPSLTLTERSLARFLREAALMRRVEHPSIARVLDLGRRGRIAFFVMEFVEGRNLDERLAVGPLPVREVAELGASCARALHFAHERGVVHRDVKPGNLIQREDGSVVITDFGLARESGSGSMTESGAIVGTPMYMAPEQVLGERDAIGSRTDVYGLGATLYTLLAGRPPFEGGSAQHVLRQVLERRPPRLARLRADVPRDLEAILAKSMSPAPAQRYGSAQEFADDLDRFLRGERVLARLPGPVGRAWAAARARPLLSGLCAVIAMLALGAFALQQDRQRNRLEASLAGAERSLALASRASDDLGRRLTPRERSDLLYDSLARASEVIAQDTTYWRAWFVRAKAHYQLNAWREAISDLDATERVLGEATPDLLRFRIEALSHLGDLRSRAELQTNLFRLLDLDPSRSNRCVVASEMLRMANALPPGDRPEVLGTVERVLGAAVADDPQDVSVRALLLQVQGDVEGALTMIQSAEARFPADAIVHATAADLYRRVGLDEDADAAAERAAALDPRYVPLPDAGGTREPAGVDVGEIQGFFDGLDTLIRSADRQR